MGNSCKGLQEPSISYDGDACRTRPRDQEKKKNNRNYETEGSAATPSANSSRPSSTPAAGAGGCSSREVKIRIKMKMRKHQLEELLRLAGEGNGVPLRHVLAGRLVSIRCDDDSTPRQQKHWRPKLQSIPELPAE